jgi:sec-independent protein translocase protein TatA
MGALAPWHFAILALLVVLLFGAKRLPDSARALGRSMRILKAETQDLRHDDATATPSPVDVSTTPADEPPALPARSSTLEAQRAEALRFLAATEQPARTPQPPPTSLS